MSERGHHPAPLSPVERRVAALEALLTEDDWKESMAATTRRPK